MVSFQSSPSVLPFLAFSSFPRSSQIFPISIFCGTFKFSGNLALAFGQKLVAAFRSHAMCFQGSEASWNVVWTFDPIKSSD